MKRRKQKQKKEDSTIESNRDRKIKRENRYDKRTIRRD